MSRSAGVLVVEHIAAGLVEKNQVTGAVQVFPEAGDSHDALLSMPADHIAIKIADLVSSVAKNNSLDAVGVGFPGIIRDGVVEESPNLQQIKGFNLRGAVESALAANGARVAVRVCNDADATARRSPPRAACCTSSIGCGHLATELDSGGIPGVKAHGRADIRW